jgi:predicted CoA-binding protein
MNTDAHSEAGRKAEENSIDVIYNRCMMVEHRRIFG